MDGYECLSNNPEQPENSEHISDSFSTGKSLPF